MRYFNYHSRIIPGLLFVFLLILSVSVNDSRRAGRSANNVEFTESIRGMQPSSPKSDYPNNSIVYDMESIDTKDWIDIHDPEYSFGGYTLFFYHQRIPMIMDMNGSIVHAWPEVRGWGRMRLTREGHLILIGTDNLIHEYDWGGNHLWSFDIDRGMDFPHHDFRIGRNGNILCIYRDAGNGTDYIVEIKREEHIEWEWLSNDHIRSHFGSLVKTGLDVTHFNSIQELPENPYYADGDDRFKPGNILISARELNTIFVVDRETGRIVWDYCDGLDRQHEAIMIQEGHDNNGHILVFNNGTDNLYRYRRSQVLEIDPVERRIVWMYETPYFFSSIQGMQQHLPNGNIMISSTRGGRLFEIDRNGTIVWQFIPPFDPMRPERYPFDYCPNFSEFGSREYRTVIRSPSKPYIDKDLYRFEIRGRLRKTMVAGELREVLRQEALQPPCRLLTIPDDAEILIGFGSDWETNPGSAIRPSDLHVSVILEIEGSDHRERILDYSFERGERSRWVENQIPLNDYGNKRVNLCLIQEYGEDFRNASGNEIIYWTNPEIITGADSKKDLKSSIPEGADVDSLIAIQRLQALGYMD